MQILPALGFGGVERGVIDLTKELQKSGFDPIVVSSGGVLVYQLRDLGIKHIELGINTKNPLRIFFNIAKIVKLIKENNVDIVHVRSRAPMWSAYYACKKTGTKLVSTVHGTYSLGLLFQKNFALKRAYNAIMLRADQIIAVSDFIKSYILSNYIKGKDAQLTEANTKLLSKKIKVIHRGVDLNYFDPSKVSQTRLINLSTSWNIPEDKKIILMPARFTAWKGHEFLINALAKVKSEFFCIMVGGDQGHVKYRKSIEQKIIKNELEGKVRLTKPCTDMPAAYLISDLVVVPSLRAEAFGRVVVEAQAMSRLVITTNIGGAKETVMDGKTGFLVEVGNVEKLAELIDRALNLTESDKIKSEARKHVSELFSNERMCKETIKVYNNILR